MKIEPILSVTLTVAEFQRACQIGDLRWKKDKDSGIPEKRLSYKDPHRINVQGAVGEFAFAKMFGFEMEVDTDPRKGGIDFRCENGITIDVKHTENTMDPKLRNPAYKIGKEYHADVYVLIAGQLDLEPFGMMGWIFHGELMKEKNISKGSCTLPAKELRRHIGTFRILIGRKT